MSADSQHPIENEILLRDHFAAVALEGAFRCDLTEFYEEIPVRRLKVAKQAYAWADVMLDARIG